MNVPADAFPDILDIFTSGYFGLTLDILAKWARKRSGAAFEAGFIALLWLLLTWNLVRYVHIFDQTLYIINVLIFRSLRISILEKARHHTQTHCLNMTGPMYVTSRSLTPTPE